MIVSPFTENVNYKFSEQQFETFSNKNFPDGEAEIKNEKGESIKVEVKGNKLTATGLGHNSLESVQKIYDWLLGYLKLDKTGRFRGYVSLKHHNVLFHIEKYKDGGEEDFGKTSKKKKNK